jgi:hypothetical protein
MLPLQGVIAHLTLHAARIATISARHDALVEDLMEHLLAVKCLVPRGEKGRG